EKTLGHEWAKHASSLRAERFSESDFARANHAASEEQIRDVQAGDQEKNQRRPGNDEQSGAEVAHYILEERPGDELKRTVVSHELQPAGENIELSLELCAGDAGPRAYVSVHVEKTLGAGARIDLGPHGRTHGILDPLAGDADDVELRCIDQNGSPDDIRIGRENVSPGLIAQNRLVEIVSGLEPTAQSQRIGEDLEELLRDAVLVDRESRALAVDDGRFERVPIHCGLDGLAVIGQRIDENAAKRPQGKPLRVYGTEP